MGMRYSPFKFTTDPPSLRLRRGKDTEMKIFSFCRLETGKKKPLSGFAEIYPYPEGRLVFAFHPLNGKQKRKLISVFSVSLW
jgi:hypothetical protein